MPVLRCGAALAMSIRDKASTGARPMKCPIDQRDLVMTERRGIEIDQRPACRGKWLDRGELDRIIERAVPQVASVQPPPVRERREP